MNRQSHLQVYASPDHRKAKLHRPKRECLASHVNKGKVYPYNSTKRHYPVGSSRVGWNITSPFGKPA